MSRINNINPGDLLPETEHPTDTKQQFLYNAALWNAHRIHFDYQYATEVEGYPGLVMAGPLMGEWLTQNVNDWLGDDGRIVSFEFSNRQAAYVGEVLRSGGKVVSTEPDEGTAVLEVFVSNEAGDILTPGQVVVRFDD
jgi:hydroxyacyl-ACP dehydratase HTD2-like protein with hotdog domain